LYNDWYHYYYSVLFALILYPLAFIPLYLAKFLWLVLNLFFVFRIWKIFSYYLGTDRLTVKMRRIFTFLSFLFILRFLRDNFHLAQMTTCILYLTMEGLYQIDRRRELAGSLLIALGIDIKILPLVVIPWLIYRARFRPVVYTLVFLCILLVLPSLLIGFKYNAFLLKERWKLVNPTNQKHILDVDEDSFHSLTTLCSVLLVKNARNNNSLLLKRNIADIPLKDLSVVINAVRAFFVLLALWFIHDRPFRKEKSRLQEFYELSYVLLAAPLLFPHQQHYAFLLAFPATTYLVLYLLEVYFGGPPREPLSRSRKINKVILITLTIIIYLVLNAHFILGQYNDLYDHFKILTYGVLLLAGVLAFCRPSKIKTIPL